MSPLDIELFQLIGGLSKKEKQGYRKHCANHTREGKNNYLQLFNHICDQDKCQPDAWQEWAEKTGVGSYLPSLKNRLMTNLLRYLEAREDLRDPEFEVQKLLSRAKILLSRGLYRSCSKRLKKARELSEKNDLFLYSLRAGELERALYFHIRNRDISLHAARIANREIDNMNRNSLRLKCDLLALRAHALAKEKLIRGENDEEVRLLQDELSSLQESALVDSGSRISWLDAAGLVAIMQNHFPEAKRHYGILMEEWKMKPSLIRLKVHEFITGLFNYLNICLIHKEFDELDSALRTAENLPVEDALQSIRLQLNLHHHRLMYYMNSGRLNESFDLIPELRRFIRHNETQITVSRKHGMYYNMASLSFISGNYTDAMRSLRDILDMTQTDAHTRAIAFAASLIQLPSLYELDEHNWLENNIRAVKRKIPKSGLVQLTAGTLIKVLNRGLKDGSDAMNRACAEAADKLGDALNWQKQAPPIGFMEILYWLRARAAGVGIKDLYLSGFEK